MITNHKRPALIIFPVTKTYLLEGIILLKSLTKHMPNVPVHVISKDNEADHLLAEFDIVEKVINEPECDSEFRQIRTSRFRHAKDVAEEFTSVCLLDADMLCVFNFEHIFRMVDTGTILTCSNNTLLRYRAKDFDLLEIPCDPDIDVVHTSFSTVPFFINPTIHADFLNQIWTSKSGNDLEAINLLAITNGLMDRVFLLNSYCHTNIHHSCLKSETHIKKVDDGYCSQQGDRVYMFHGHWLDKNYVKELMEPMIKHYSYYPKHIECAQNCINVMEQEYKQYTESTK